MASMPLLIMKLAMPVSPSPTLPRWGERSEGGEAEQTNRYASFTLNAGRGNAVGAIHESPARDEVG